MKVTQSLEGEIREGVDEMCKDAFVDRKSQTLIKVMHKQNGILSIL